jgi:hypothetical protein
MVMILQTRIVGVKQEDTGNSANSIAKIKRGLS